MSRTGEEVADPVLARLAVDVVGVVVVLEGAAIAEELVEGLLPRPFVDDRGLGQDTVEIEQAGGDAVRETQHCRGGYLRRNARIRSS